MALQLLDCPSTQEIKWSILPKATFVHSSISRIPKTMFKMIQNSGRYNRWLNPKWDRLGCSPMPLQKDGRRMVVWHTSLIGRFTRHIWLLVLYRLLLMATKQAHCTFQCQLAQAKPQERSGASCSLPKNIPINGYALWASTTMQSRKFMLH